MTPGEVFFAVLAALLVVVAVVAIGITLGVALWRVHEWRIERRRRHQGGEVGRG